MKIDFKPYDFDNDLIKHTREDRKPRIAVYRAPITAVVLGKGSDPEVELNIHACIEDGIPILKRAGGGCAVVLDQGNVIVSIVLPTTGISGNKQYFNKISGWLIDKLKLIGIEGVYQDGISDLVIDDRKVGGSSIHRSKDHLYYSSTLLVEPRIYMIEQYLRHPPREPEYRKKRRHRDFISSLPVGDQKDKAKWLVENLEKVIKEQELKEFV